MIEDVLNNMKTTLETYCPAEFDRQDGKYGDGIELEDIAQILVADETIGEEGLPVILLRPEGTQYDHKVTGKKDVNHTITLGVVVTDTDEANCQKRLYRTIRGIENVMETKLPGRNGIIEYQTTDITYNVTLFDVDDIRSTEKGGIITAAVKERLDAYTDGQL